MSGFRLQRADVTGEAQPVWLLRFPGDSERPLALPDGNLQEVIREYLDQGGKVPEAENESSVDSVPAEPRQGSLFDA